MPNVGGALRTMWAGLMRGREALLPTAFALDSVALEALFTAGPLLAAAIIAVASPLAALVVSRRLLAHRHAGVRRPAAVARVAARSARRRPRGAWAR